MDYEFRRNTFDNTLHAHFSMGHEALGRWLQDELGISHQDIDEVLLNLRRVVAQGGQWRREGRVFFLHVTQEEALIQANVLSEEIEEDMPEKDFHAYDEESFCICGPEDLLSVLEGWQDFLRRYAR